VSLRVLLVDDSKLQRRLLRIALHKRGFAVIEAEDAEEGLAIFAREPVDIVISDWVMPGMSGPDFCQHLRANSGDRYVYIILLTAKSESSEIAQGFDAGADDFLSKPVNAVELGARLGAGQRVLHFERELKRSNTLLSETVAELRSLYSALDSDLVQAKQLQDSLLPDRLSRFGNTQVGVLLESSGRVGGDLVGAFAINARQVCAFAIDVSGHGVSSALMTARLAGMFSGQMPGKNIAIGADAAGGAIGRDPAEIAADMNRVLLEEMDTDHYFTLFLCILNLETGLMHFVQAGHPPAIHLSPDGQARLIGVNGFPIGLLDTAQYQTETLQLAGGDRVLLSSDGLTECAGPDGRLLEEGGLLRLAQKNRFAAPLQFLEMLKEDLVEFCGKPQFEDDISAVLLSFGAQSPVVASPFE